MKRKSRIREKFEDNSLIIIAMMMVTLYGIFDFLSGGHYLTRILIIVLVITYGVFAQMLINSRKVVLAAKEAAQHRFIQSERLAALGAMAAGIGGIASDDSLPTSGNIMQIVIGLNLTRLFCQQTLSFRVRPTEPSGDC